MNNANEKVAIRPVLPAHGYYAPLLKKVKRKVLDYINVRTEKSQGTSLRWLRGEVRPTTPAERKVVADALKKYADCKLTGNELFPEDFPYTGAHN